MNVNNLILKVLIELIVEILIKELTSVRVDIPVFLFFVSFDFQD